MVPMQSYLKQIYGAMVARGVFVTLRKVTNTGGATPLINPPTVENPVVDGAALAGAQTISIRAAAAQGVFFAGDQIIVSGSIYHVAAQTAARGFAVQVKGFSNIPLTAGLVANVADGTPVSLAYATDVSVPGKIGSFDASLVDGKTVLMTDLMIELPAYNINPPSALDRIIIAGVEKDIVTITPKYIRGTIVKWILQAR